MNNCHCEEQRRKARARAHSATRAAFRTERASEPRWEHDQAAVRHNLRGESQYPTAHRYAADAHVSASNAHRDADALWNAHKGTGCERVWDGNYFNLVEQAWFAAERASTAAEFASHAAHAGRYDAARAGKNWAEDESLRVTENLKEITKRMTPDDIELERTNDDGSWSPVSVEEARNVLAGYYKDVDLAMEDILTGATLRTMGRFYRLKAS